MKEAVLVSAVRTDVGKAPTVPGPGLRQILGSPDFDWTGPALLLLLRGIDTSVFGGMLFPAFVASVSATVAAVLVLLQHLIQHYEENTLNAVGQYCLDNLINRLFVD